MSISLGVFSWAGEISKRNFLQFLGRVCVWLLAFWEVKGERRLKIWTSVCLHCVWVFVYAQSCLTLYNPLDWSPPGLSVHGIFQARILVGCHFLLQEIFQTQGLNLPLLCVLHGRGILYQCATIELPSPTPQLLFYNPKSSSYRSRKQNSCLLSGWERGTGLCVSLVSYAFDKTLLLSPSSSQLSDILKATNSWDFVGSPMLIFLLSIPNVELKKKKRSQGYNVSFHSSIFFSVSGPLPFSLSFYGFMPLKKIHLQSF